MRKINVGWISLVATNAVALCVLGFYGTSGAAPQGAKQPFSNSVEQRHEMIQELREIKSLLKEQNEILRAAAVKGGRNEPKRD
jgi:hypothetical protein